MKFTMDDSEYELFKDYVWDIASFMKLADWDIYLKNDFKEGKNYLGKIRTVPGRRIATIRFTLTFLNRSAYDQRWTVVHELTHIWFDGAFNAVAQDIPNAKMLGWKAENLMIEYFRRNMEIGIDEVARCIAMTIPTFEEYKITAAAIEKDQRYMSFYECATNLLRRINDAADAKFRWVDGKGISTVETTEKKSDEKPKRKPNTRKR